MASLEAGLSVKGREKVRMGIDSLGMHVGIQVRGIWDQNYGYKRRD